MSTTTGARCALAAAILCGALGCSASSSPEPAAEVSAVNAAPATAPSVSEVVTAPVPSAPASQTVSASAASKAQLPKVCAADSPNDDGPCSMVAGIYHVVIEPSPGAEKSDGCFLQNAAQASFQLQGGTYNGIGQATELTALGKALGLKKPELRIGAALREGVCCVDLDLSESGKQGRAARIHLAAGATKVNAKGDERRFTANEDCRHKVAVTVTKLSM